MFCIYLMLCYLILCLLHVIDKIMEVLKQIIWFNSWHFCCLFSQVFTFSSNSVSFVSSLFNSVLNLYFYFFLKEKLFSSVFLTCILLSNKWFSSFWSKLTLATKSLFSFFSKCTSIIISSLKFVVKDLIKTCLK